LPSQIFVVASIHQGLHHPVISTPKQDSPLHSRAEKQVRSLTQKGSLVAPGALRIQGSALGGNGHGVSRRELVGANEISISRRGGLRRRGILVKTKNLAGHDLPVAISQQPGVRSVIASLELLPEDDFGFVHVIAQDGGVGENAALRRNEPNVP